MDFSKIDKISEKMNKITRELTKNVEISEDILTTTDDLTEVFTQVQERPKKSILTPEIKEDIKINEIMVIPCNPDPEDESPSLDINAMVSSTMNIDSMVEDFEYMRRSLRDTTDTTKRILGTITSKLEDLDGFEADAGERTQLVMSFTELNRTQLEGIRLFMQSYKDISSILTNFAKIHASTKVTDGPKNVYTTNVMNIEGPQSPADIIKKLRDE